MNTIRLIAVVFVLFLTGCAQLGPLFVDPRVYNSSAKSISAGNRANEAFYNDLEVYHDTQAASYAAGGDGYVNGVSRRYPGRYYTGCLSNPYDQPATFQINGEISNTTIVPPRTNLTAQLPAGPYTYSIRLNYKSRPRFLDRGEFTIDSQTGDYTFVDPRTGEAGVYDWYIVAH